MARIGASAVFERISRRIGGGRLVYGKPLRVGERAVIPVSRVRVTGGFGFGGRGEEEGGGGGGLLNARPAGFIDVGPEGARYEAIPREQGRVAAIAGAVLSARAITRVGRALGPAARRLGPPRRLLRR